MHLTVADLCCETEGEHILLEEKDVPASQWGWQVKRFARKIFGALHESLTAMTGCSICDVFRCISHTSGHLDVFQKLCVCQGVGREVFCDSRWQCGGWVIRRPQAAASYPVWHRAHTASSPGALCTGYCLACWARWLPPLRSYNWAGCPGSLCRGPPG